MWGLSLTMILVFGLFIYADKRMPPTSPEMTNHRREVNFAKEDAIWPFCEALSLLKKTSAEMDFLLLTPTLPNVMRIPLNQTYPPEQQEALRRYVEGNRKTLALIHEGVASGTFDSICSLWPITREPRRYYGPHTSQGYYPYEIHGIQDITLYIRRTKWDRVPLNLKPLARLMGCGALNAVLQDDVKSFLTMTDLALDTVHILMNETILPDMLFKNLDAGFSALDMTEEAINRMDLDNGSLDHLRQKIAARLYNRQQDIVTSYRNHMEDCLEALKTAREASRIPEHHYEPNSSQRFIFDNSFGVLWQAWLYGSAFNRQYVFHELMNVVRLGHYYRYGGYKSALITPEPAVEGQMLRNYISPYSYRRRPGSQTVRRRPFNVFSKEARRLRNEEQVLWPGYEDYEPYFELLAYARIAECALLATQYRNDTGNLPDTLEALVPHYLHELPRDPYTYEQPLRYRRAADRLVVYSIGPNREDDGGVRCPKQARFHDKSQQESTTDIVIEVLDRTIGDGAGAVAPHESQEIYEPPRISES
jgi:hypothetical protein